MDLNDGLPRCHFRLESASLWLNPQHEIFETHVNEQLSMIIIGGETWRKIFIYFEQKGKEKTNKIKKHRLD